MLAKENSAEFMATMKQVLDQIKIHPKGDEDLEEPDDKTNLEEIMKIAEKKIAYERKEISDMSLLKNSIYAFIGNLCIEKTLRTSFANDQSGILSQIITDFKSDLKGKAFDWMDMMMKQLAIFINVGLEI